MARWVVVTGASTGIGRAVLDALIRSGFSVFGGVRKAADAQTLSDALGPAFYPLIFDVTDESAVAAAAQVVKERIGNDMLAGLINNAGIAIACPLVVQSREDFQHHLDVNLVGPFLTTKAFAPLLGTDRARSGRPGRIINVSSIGGKLAPPFVGAYVAAKHGLEAYSESLRRELLLYGIDVIVVGPGAVATPIWDKTEALDVSAVAGTEWEEPFRRFMARFIASGRQGFPPAQIATVIVNALNTAKPRVRYAPVYAPFRNWILPRLLPKRFVDRLIGRDAGLLPP